MLDLAGRCRRDSRAYAERATSRCRPCRGRRAGFAARSRHRSRQLRLAAARPVRSGDRDRIAGALRRTRSERRRHRRAPRRWRAASRSSMTCRSASARHARPGAVPVGLARTDARRAPPSQGGARAPRPCDRRRSRSDGRAAAANTRAHRTARDAEPRAAPPCASAALRELLDSYRGGLRSSASIAPRLMRYRLIVAEKLGNYANAPSNAASYGKSQPRA